MTPRTPKTLYRHIVEKTKNKENCAISETTKCTSISDLQCMQIVQRSLVPVVGHQGIYGTISHEPLSSLIKLCLTDQQQILKILITSPKNKYLHTTDIQMTHHFIYSQTSNPKYHSIEPMNHRTKIEIIQQKNCHLHKDSLTNNIVKHPLQQEKT